MSHRMTFVLAAAALFAVISGSATAQSFEGRKKCSSCHKSQAESWGETAHAKAMDSLKPGTKEEAKKKAKLDPKKDYTKDKDCVGCHVDGWGKEGGYTLDDPSKFLTGVGCESCHGPGSKYRGMHRKAGAAFEKSKKTAPRQSLADAGQDFAFEESCNACHMNYEGSGWKGVRSPTPRITLEWIRNTPSTLTSTSRMRRPCMSTTSWTAPSPGIRSSSTMTTSRPRPRLARRPR